MITFDFVTLFDLIRILILKFQMCGLVLCNKSNVCVRVIGKFFLSFFAEVIDLDFEDTQKGNEISC